jgi:hypothetical protein
LFHRRSYAIAADKARGQVAARVQAADGAKIDAAEQKNRPGYLFAFAGESAPSPRLAEASDGHIPAVSG